jgi:hypothetical protein
LTAGWEHRAAGDRCSGLPPQFFTVELSPACPRHISSLSENSYQCSCHLFTVAFSGSWTFRGTVCFLVRVHVAPTTQSNQQSLTTNTHPTPLTIRTRRRRSRMIHHGGALQRRASTHPCPMKRELLLVDYGLSRRR